MSLRGRTALVTGASRGIGRSIAVALAEDGADVAINYRRDRKAAEKTLGMVRSLGRKGKTYQAAVEDPEASRLMIEQVHRDFGSIGILVNNAGIASRGNTVVDTEASELLRVMTVNAMAVHYLSRLVLPAMRKLERGDIIMVSSVATRSLAAHSAPYSMSKCALEALAYVLAKEERQYDIRVNIVAPGLVETDMGRKLVRATRGIENLRELDAAMPFGRVCQPDDVANAVRFLVAPRNSHVTGERLYIDGGGRLDS